MKLVEIDIKEFIPCFECKKKSDYEIFFGSTSFGICKECLKEYAEKISKCI